MDHSYGFEQHVAQQSRRDKLRVSPGNSFDHSRLNRDLVRIHSVKNAISPSDSSLLPSEMIDFSVGSNVISDQRDNIMFRQELGLAPCGRQFVTTVEDASFSNSLLRASGDVVNGGYWKSSQQSCDWVVNCANNSLADDITPSSMLTDSTYIGFQSSSSFINPSGESFNQDTRKRLGESHFPSPLYQNTLHDVVTSASIVQHNFREINRAGCEGSGNELALLPAFRDQSNGLPFDNNGSWNDRTYDNFRSWVGDLGSIARKNDEEMRTFMNDSSNPQGLSLSLSSNPSTKLLTTHFEESEDLCETNNNMLKNLQDSRTVKTEDLCRLPKPFIADKNCGKSLQDMIGVPVNTYRNTGPLGPFTGYATILKSSKFLKPAQLLLDEFCGSDCPKLSKPCEVFEKTYVEVISSASSDAAALNVFRNEVGFKGSNSRAEASTFYGSNETSVSGVGSISPESHQPEYQQKKAKLLYLLEEICRRYKQYHQQMQMVVSSFESVAGLSSATPYISLALKIVSRHFRCLKNAITEQLKYLKKVLGEDLSSPTTAGTSSISKGDIDSAKLKYMEQSLQKQKPGIVNMAGFLESQHVWRPQRGLPERAVAILRAWLFEHFLHPYPTDTDKHMLATQTGLSRNQVSNWFINARVRVWKPMVEEIHMLETKAGLTEMNKSHGTNDGIENTDWTGSEHRLKNHGVNDQQWNNEKQSKLEGGHVQPNMEGEFIGFMPYQSQPQPSTVEVGAGLGAVSLTLGLRHRVESAHHQQHLQQQNDQLMRQYGSEMIHEFVG